MDAWTTLTLHRLTISERHREAAQRRLAKLAATAPDRNHPTRQLKQAPARECIRQA